MESEHEGTDAGPGARSNGSFEPRSTPRGMFSRIRRFLTGVDPHELAALRGEWQRMRGDVERMRVRVKELEANVEDALASFANGAPDADDSMRVDSQGIVSCRGFVVLDKGNRARIRAGVDENGDATICWIDPMGKRRVVAGTAINGDASVLWLDVEGKRRMGAAAAANGNAGMYFADRNDVMRVGIATKNSGTGGVHVYDKDGKLRISAATFKDEQLSLPNEDLGSI